MAAGQTNPKPPRFGGANFITMSEEHKLKLLKLELFNKLTTDATELLSNPDIVAVTDKLDITYHFISDDVKIQVLVQHKELKHGYAFSMHYDNDMNLILTNRYSGECVSVGTITQKLIDI